MNIVIIMAPESLVFSLFSVASDVKVAWTECELRLQIVCHHRRFRHGTK